MLVTAAVASAAIGLYAMTHKPGLRISIKCRKWDVVRSILDTEEGKERVQTKLYTNLRSNGEKDNVTALHLACLHGAPSDVIKTLIDISSDLVSKTSDPGEELPLHYVIYGMKKTKPSLRDETVLNILIHAFPKGVRSQSSNGNNMQTPLHIACALKMHFRTIQILHDGDPSARYIFDLHEKSARDIAKTRSPLWSYFWRHQVLSLLKPEEVLVSTATYKDKLKSLDPPEDKSKIPDKSHIPVATPIQNPADTTSLYAPWTPPNKNHVIDNLPVENPPYQNPSYESNNSEDSDDGEDTMELCIYCCSKKPNCVFVPCGHVCLCTKCYKKHSAALQQKCPVCRGNIEKTVKIYPSGI